MLLSNATVGTDSLLKMLTFATARVTRQRSCINAIQQLQHFSTGPVTTSYKNHIENGTIQHDNEQRQLAARLDRLHEELTSTRNAPSPHQLDISMFSGNPSVWERTKLAVSKALFPAPRGIYVYGSVGVGKSFLMDLFYQTLADAVEQGHVRIHFHEFMLHVHDSIHQYKRRHPRGDALPAVALQLAQKWRVLCFDEFQVTDIADAMILKRLFGMLLDAGVVVVATSNRAPEELYQGGINRVLFLPFIDTLQANLDIVQMTGQHDYRRRDTGSNKEESSLPFFWPNDNASVRLALEHIFYLDGSDARAETIPVQMGRVVKVPRATDSVAWFDFMDLCHEPLGAADYLAICEHYDVLIVDHVPQLNSSRFNEARRFVTLIDALYETKTRLVMACEMPLEHLFVDFDVEAETRDGDEEIAVEEEPGETDNHEDMFVKGEGGSSSSASITMIRTKDGDVEWSATGRIGVSLAQLSAVRDVSFSFQRAESRLAEMNSSSWGR